MATKKKFDPLDYVNTQELKYSKRYTEKELAKVYSYFRTVAKKRINRLEQYGYTKTAQYQRMKAIGLPILKEIENRNQLAMYLQQTAFFISTESSTISGIKRIRKQKLEQFQEMGFTGINESNYDDFIDFFETAKAKNVRGSDFEEAAKVWNLGRKAKAKPKQIIDDYNKYTELISKAESAISKPVEKTTSEEVIAYLAGKK